MIAKYIFQGVLKTKLDKQLKVGSSYSKMLLLWLFTNYWMIETKFIITFRICGKREASTSVHNSPKVWLRTRLLPRLSLKKIGTGKTKEQLFKKTLYPFAMPVKVWLATNNYTYNTKTTIHKERSYSFSCLKLVKVL